MVGRAGFLALILALLMSHACLLDWDLPESAAGGAGGGEGGALPYNLICCKVCHPAPSLCPTSARLNFTLSGPCTGYFHEGGMCREIVDCGCENCEMLPDTPVQCENVVLDDCNNCLFD